MKENYEIEKKLKFNTNLAEVLSISLEEKHEIKDNLISGNFIISGEYKIHEISLNKEKFNFKIPFEEAIKNDIDLNTVNLEITNFIYDTDNENLFVTIEYEICGDRKDILLFDDEEDLDEFLKSREVEVILDDAINDIDNVLEKEEDIKEEKEELIEKNEEIVGNDCENRNIEKAKEELLNNVKVDDDNFITYQIHIVKETDTLESILTKYQMTLDEIKEYNDFNVLSLGDKLIIPIINEK